MYIFRRSVTGRRVSPFCILLAQGEIHAQGENPPHDPPYTHTRKHTPRARGHLNWRMGLPALLDGNLGCWIV